MKFVIRWVILILAVIGIVSLASKGFFLSALLSVCFLGAMVWARMIPAWAVAIALTSAVFLAQKFHLPMLAEAHAPSILLAVLGFFGRWIVVSLYRWASCAKGCAAAAQ